MSVKEKPPKFSMVIQGGMLDALGINMYSTLAKSMVEFVANAYDSDATSVNISVPFDRISDARSEVRAAAKLEVDAGIRERFTLLLLPLPEDIEITISDNGHGMDPRDIASKFIPVNRKRRLDASGKESVLTTENGRRKVMGRKGLGKLAGFGVAEKVTIKTKRKNDDFWTIFHMDYVTLSSAADLSGVDIPAEYIPGVVGENGTEITLSRLRCDALKRGRNDLEHTLRQNFFGIKAEDFGIFLNGPPLPPELHDYEFTFPDHRPHEGFARQAISVPDMADFEFDYVVKFRKSGDSLRSDQRGARIYCHNRLAAGPSLFRLPSGVHNYHGQDYLECIVQADQLDELGIDLVSTDRTQLKAESELVIAFLEALTDILKRSLAAHYKHKEVAADRAIEEQASPWARVVNNMPPKTRAAARKLLRLIGTEYGTDSDDFNQIAPLVLDTMNASEVLVKLIDIGVNPQNVPQVMDALRELREIEKSDALKIFRARREGVTALRTLADRGEEEYRKVQFEGDLQALLKRCPWLIRQEYAHYLTSDEKLETVCSQLAAHLEVDHHAKDNPKNPDLRPDLVFLMQETRAYEIVVVELKSPSIPLEIGHLNQLQGYIMDIEQWLQRKLSNSAPRVHGYLIGQRLPIEKRSREASILENSILKAGPTAQWKVLDLRELLHDTENAHAEMIRSLEQELGEEHIMTLKSPSTQLVRSSQNSIAADVKPNLASDVTTRGMETATTNHDTESGISALDD